MTSISSAALQVVNEHLIQTYATGSLSEPQLKAIVLTALELIETQGFETKTKAWIKAELLTDDQQAKLITAVNAILVSAESPWQPKGELVSPVQKIFFDLLRGNAVSFSDIKEQSDFLPAVVWKKNPELLAQARNLVQNIFQEMYEDIAEKKLTPQQSFHQEVIIGDLLALYPFLRPPEGSELSVPILIDGQWQLAPYAVQKIELTPKWLGSPPTAYGLNPKNESHPPLLLYKGTTYPTDKGFLLSLLVDINPFASVGSYIFQIGKKKIKEWLKTQTKNKKALIYGKSLGGTQSWRTALYFPQYVDTVMAYGAPGLSGRDKRKLHKLLDKPNHPDFYFFYQENDPVPFLDKTAEKGIHYFLVTTDSPKKGLLAHASMYSTQSKSTIILNHNFHTTSKWKRLSLTTLRAAISLVVFPIFLSFYVVYNLARLTNKQIKKYVVRVLESQ